MSKKLEMDGSPDDLITASQVAEIWNKRALEMGYRRKYTRRSVNVRRSYEDKAGGAHILIPAQSTKLGNLYRRKDAWEFPIRPDLGRKVKSEEKEDAA